MISRTQEARSSSALPAYPQATTRTKKQPLRSFSKRMALAGGDLATSVGTRFESPELSSGLFWSFANFFFIFQSQGEFNEYGQLSIIDRKSNFIKIQSGYYVTLAKVNLAAKIEMFLI